MDHSARCDALSGCSSCHGCPDCKSMFPCTCRDEAEAKAAAPKPVRKLSMASAALANRRPRNLDGSWTSRQFAQQAQRIGDIIRAARAEREAEEGGR